MRALTIGAVVMLFLKAGLAQAEGNDRYNGKYLVSGTTHRTPATKGKIVAKKKSAPSFNPKEIAVDKPVPWQKTPRDSSKQMK